MTAALRRAGSTRQLDEEGRSAARCILPPPIAVVVSNVPSNRLPRLLLLGVLMNELESAFECCDRARFDGALVAIRPLSDGLGRRD